MASKGTERGLDARLTPDCQPNYVLPSAASITRAAAASACRNRTNRFLAEYSASHAQVGD
jgi:hypothetical protein